ncbi:maltose O-acetyltransferase [Jatrophihabitans sp. GAS493]|uniref:acyltransferase n=1 Tax=Jatrophihabitans sp. GAS493 TaxID=1907575 RepID=UPI000BC0B02E|nr:acyltransferase [Jatrophihabitans sp. GAS493]SOD71576.1 maltose O-acetyltransferase [Jatrophihabitans sp. GAS493]
MPHKLYDTARVASETAFGLLRGRVVGALGVTLGRRPIFLGSRPRLIGSGQIRVGDYLLVSGATWRVTLCAEEGAVLQIGDCCFINQGVTLSARERITIGDNVMFGDGATVLDTDFHQVDASAAIKTRPIVIGDNVWISRDVLISPGVTVGAGSVIAAGSVVTRDIPPGVLAAGTPARVVRELELPDGWVRQDVTRNKPLLNALRRSR